MDTFFILVGVIWAIAMASVLVYGIVFAVTEEQQLEEIE